MVLPLKNKCLIITVNVDVVLLMLPFSISNLSSGDTCNILSTYEYIPMKLLYDKGQLLVIGVNED